MKFLKTGKLQKKGELTARTVERFYALSDTGVLHYRKEAFNTDTGVIPPLKKSGTVSNIVSGKSAEDKGQISGFRSVSFEPAGKMVAIVLSAESKGVVKKHRLMCETRGEAEEWIEAISKFVPDGEDKDTGLTDQQKIDVCQAAIGAWAEGKYNGDDREAAIAEQWDTSVCFFDANANGYEYKNTNIYRRYEGVTGLCIWFDALAENEFHDIKFDPVGVEGDVVTYKVTYSMTFKGTGKKTVPQEEKHESKLVGDKIASWSVFTTTGEELDAVYVADKPTMPTREGILHKRGAVNTAYKERRFVLENGKLEYYENKPNGKLKGTITLDPEWKVEAVKEEDKQYDAKNPYAFELTPSTTSESSRVYKLKANSEVLQNAWVKDIKDTLPLITDEDIVSNGPDKESDEEVETKEVAFADITDDDKAKVDVCEAAIAAWGGGKYNAEGREAVIEEQWVTPKCLIDANANGYKFKNTKIYKKYKGVSGLCTWFDAITELEFHDIKFEPVSVKGDIVLFKVTYSMTNKSTGKTSTPQEEKHEALVVDGKISSWSMFNYSAGEIDAVYKKQTKEEKAAKNDQEKIDVCQLAIATWGEGKYNGEDRKTVIAEQWATPDCFFDANANGNEFKNTDVYKRYDGVDGLCAWFDALADNEFHDMKFEPVNVKDNVVMYRVTYSMTHKPTGKKTPPQEEKHEAVVVDGKIVSWSAFIYTPEDIDAVHVADTPVEVYNKFVTAPADADAPAPKTIKAGYGFSSNADIKAAVAEAVSQTGIEKPSFSFVACTVAQDTDEVAKEFDGAIRSGDIHGITSSGAVLQAGKAEAGVAVLSLEAPSESLCSAYGSTALEAAQTLKVKMFEPSAIILATTPGAEDEAIEKIAEVFGGEVPVHGGTAADNELNGSWKVIVRGKAMSEGVSLVGVKEEGLKFGASMIGPYTPTEKTVTVDKAEGRKAFTLGGKPAADWVYEWLGDEVKEQYENGGLILPQTAQKPVGIKKQNGEYISSHLAGLGGEDKTVDFFTPVAAGDELTIMDSGDGPSTGYAATLAEAFDVAKTSGKIETPKAGLLFYCGGMAIAVGDKLGAALSSDGFTQRVEGLPVLGMTVFGEQTRMEGVGNVQRNLSLGFCLFE